MPSRSRLHHHLPACQSIDCSICTIWHRTPTPFLLALTLIAKAKILAMCHGRGMCSHDRHGLLGIKIKVPFGKNLIIHEWYNRSRAYRRLVHRFPCGLRHSSPCEQCIVARAIVDLANNVSHGKLQCVWTTFVQYYQVGADERSQCPNRSP